MKRYLVPFVIGVVGFLFTIGAYHLYLDHLVVDEVRGILIRQAQMQQAAQPLPTAPSSEAK